VKYFLPVLLVIFGGCSPTWESSDTVSTQSSGEKRKIIAASAERADSLNGDEVFILIYREGGFIGSASAWPVQYNDVKIGALKNGSFIAIKTNAGTKKLTPESHLGVYSEGVEAYSLKAQAGRTYYLMHGPDSIYTSKVKIREVAAADASAKVAKYSLVKVVNDYRSGPAKPGDRIVSVSGRAFIERGIKTLPANAGDQLVAGDKVNVQIGSRAVISVRGGELIITEKTSFQVPDASEAVAPPGMASQVWNEIKKLLKGQSFELKNVTSTGGVRG
jgi:uncharacterized protein DUF2846